MIGDFLFKRPVSEGVLGLMVPSRAIALNDGEQDMFFVHESDTYEVVNYLSEKLIFAVPKGVKVGKTNIRSGGWGVVPLGMAGGLPEHMSGKDLYRVGFGFSLFLAAERPFDHVVEVADYKQYFNLPDNEAVYAGFITPYGATT